MEIFSIVIAVILTAFGTAIIVYLSKLIFSPFFIFFRTHRDSGKYQKATELIATVDKLRSQKKEREALKILKRSFVLEAFEHQSLIELMKDHHQNVLSRCVTIAEELNARPEHIGLVEKLLEERSELQSLYLKALDSYQSVRHKREKIGKNIPSWSKSEFQTRLDEIQKQLELSKEELEKAIEKLFNSIEAQNSSTVVYH